jgi:DNA-binding NtrC family response regulator
VPGQTLRRLAECGVIHWDEGKRGSSEVVRVENPIWAVAIHDHIEPCAELEGILRDLSVEVRAAKRCSEAWGLISKYQPSLVFVDLNVWRQSHNAIVNMAIEADQTFNIIVVGSLPDIEKYVSAIERGAFNYIAPPFSHDVLALVVQAAVADSRERRKSLATSPISPATN